MVINKCINVKNTNKKLTNTYKYVAYGSNLFKEQMDYRCKESKYISSGFILGHKLIFNDVATIKKSKKGKTPAVMFEITGRDKIILDNFEGAPYCYKWEKVLYIDSQTGETCEAYTYIKNNKECILPETEYLSKIIQGYRDYCLPIKYLLKAIQETWFDDYYTEDYILYGAYGSNLNMDDMLNYRCPKSIPFGTATLNNYELFYSGCASIRQKKGAKCPIGLWLIHWSDIDALDGYEGFPNFYGKKYFNLNIKDTQQPVMVYVMNGNDSDFAPSIGYADCIKNGYIDFGMDLTPLYDSLKKYKLGVM